jgi:hypothetical protein
MRKSLFLRAQIWQQQRARCRLRLACQLKA